MKGSGSLQRYRKKRNFFRTTEPRRRRDTPIGPSLHYVVQKHAARRLHYDFRLELGGTLKSWASRNAPWIRRFLKQSWISGRSLDLKQPLSRDVFLR